MKPTAPSFRLPEAKRLQGIKDLMLARVIILSLLLTITFLFQISKKNYFFIPLTNAVYYYLGFFYLITLLYALALSRIRDLNRFLIFQIVVDHLFVAGLIYFTGGKESSFPVAYFFLIIGCSLFFYRRGAFFSASFSTVLYGLILLFQLQQWIDPIGSPRASEASQVFYSLLLYMASYFIVAFLSSLIAEELRKKKKELFQKQVDYRQLETFNRNVIQSLDSGLLTIDLQGKINFWNRTAGRILGLDGKETNTLSIYDLFPAFNRITREGPNPPESPLPSQRYETPFVDADGKRRFLGFSISPLTGPEDHPAGETLIFQDITRYKELEEHLKRLDKMAAINQLAAGMAHEIRNPLTSLSGSIQMLKSELTLEAHQERLMEIILRESERLNALITDFLLFAQPPKIHKEIWNIRTLLEETLELFLHSPEYREGIQIHKPSPADKIEAPVDPDQIKQVFWNLLLNAVQSMGPKGELKINLETGQDGTSGGPARPWVRVSFSDSGRGISPEEREKIFEPFFTTKDRGTGLGLAIVHKIVDNHAGRIRVESEMGRGSTFTISLPVQSEEIKG